LITYWNNNEISCDIAYHRICHPDELCLVFIDFERVLWAILTPMALDKW